MKIIPSFSLENFIMYENLSKNITKLIIIIVNCFNFNKEHDKKLRVHII